MKRPGLLRTLHQQRGLTLIEVVTSIVIISLAAAALLGVMGFLAKSSGISLAQAQAQAIAGTYLNEALSKPFTDPNGIDGETVRALYDDVDDFDGLDDPFATDQTGTVAGNFRVRITVAAGTLGALPAAAVRRVDVTVDYADGQQARATGYRTRYP
jgi:MSHA pilin protein MshD